MTLRRSLDQCPIPAIFATGRGRADDGFYTLSMVGLLTWPTYGTWFPGRGRGRIDPQPDQPVRGVPEPVPIDAARQPRDAPWPPVRLDDHQRRAVAKDLTRIAELRDFKLHLVVVAEDHVHVLLSGEPQGDIPRLVQLIKGALSRKLTVVAGDTPPRSSSGRALPHHKWWTRQYAFLTIDNRATLDHIWPELLAHTQQDNVLCEVFSNRQSIPVD